MYAIYSKVGEHRVCLHEDTVANETVKVIDPKLTLEDNSAGSLTFKLAPNNIGYTNVEFVEQMAKGMIDLNAYDALDILVEGGIDQDGQFVDEQKYIRTMYINVPDDTIAYAIDVNCTRGSIDITESMEYGSIEDPDDPTRLMSVDFFDISTVTGEFTVDIDYEPQRINLTQRIIQGGIDKYGTPSTGGTKYVRTELIELESPILHVKFDIMLNNEDINTLQYAVYAYDENDHRINGTDWIDISYGNTFNFPSASSYIIVFSHSDGSDTSLSNYESVIHIDEKYPEYSLYMYDESYNLINHTDFRKCGVYQNINFANQKYAKAVIRYDNSTYISVAFFNTFKISRRKDVKWALHEYTSESEAIHIYGSNFVKSDSIINLQNKTAKAVRIVIEYDDESDIYVYDPIKFDVIPKKIDMQTITTSVDMVGRMVSTITVYRKEKTLNPSTGVEYYADKEIWEGRVLNEDKDFWNLRTIYCEGELSYLNDTCQPQREYPDTTFRQFLEAVLNIHNSRVPDSKKFYVGQIWISDTAPASLKTYSARHFTNFEKTMETIMTLINEYGGHIKIRKENGKRYIDWFDDYGEAQASTQTIEFGTNLLDFTSTWDMTELCTVLLPTGKVLTEGGSSSAGDPLELNNGEGPTQYQLLYQDETTKEVFIENDPSLAGYKTAVAVVEPEKNYYFSGRLHGGFVAYVIKSNADGTGDYFDGGTKIAGSSGQVGFVDFIDEKITIPPGAHSVVMCSFGDDIPLALKNEVPAVEGIDTYLTVQDVDDDDTWHKKGSLYIINQEAVDKYGWIEKRLDLEKIEDAKVLYDTAKLYLQNGQFDQMTIELTAMDMNLLGVDTNYITLLDKLRVISKPHGLDRYFPLTKLEIPLNKPAEMKFTLGTSTEQTLTGSSNDINEELLSKIAAVPSMSKTLASAKANAAEMINNAVNGYVSFVMDADGNPKELVISDAKDCMNPDSPSYNTAKVWRWNMAGLAYSNHGYHFDESNLNLALTADGSIVADRITTGILRSIQVRGCTIVVGGMDQQSGSILIKPASSSGYAIRLQNGEMQFGTVNQNEEFEEFADIKGDISYEVEGEWRHGVRLRSDVLAFDTDDLWVDGKNGGDPASGINGAYTIQTDSGPWHLGFRRGILIESWSESSNEGD